MESNAYRDSWKESKVYLQECLGKAKRLKYFLQCRRIEFYDSMTMEGINYGIMLANAEICKLESEITQLGEE